MEKSRKVKNLKLVFGIAIPMLVIVITMVMVGASFAWFSNAEKTTISEISFSTAESYRVDFTVGSALVNMPYAGQESFNKQGLLLSEGVAGSNTVDISNMPYYFVNTIALNTKGNILDITMDLDMVSIDLPARNESGELLDENNQVTNDYTKAKIVQNKKKYIETSNNVADIPYAFTWMFKEHSETHSKNYEEVTGDDSTYKKMIPLKPDSNEIWYTPYGVMKFDESRNLKLTNGTLESLGSIEDTTIKKFATSDAGNTYDFYIIFAPQELFYAQFFKDYKTALADNTLSEFTAQAVYGDNKSKLFENLNNKMFYSSMDYSGSLFTFSAIINVVGNTEGEYKQ